MTNAQKQKWLDTRKWLRSEKEHYDLSGELDYCNFCKMKAGKLCTASQSNRVENQLCAKAHNLMYEEKKDA